MNYHIQYSPNEPDKATQNVESLVNNTPLTERKKYYRNRTNVFIGLFFFFLLAAFITVVCILSKGDSNNLLKENKWNSENEDVSDYNALLKILLRSKRGKKFILSKLEELITSYEENLETFNEEKHKNKKEEEEEEEEKEKEKEKAIHGKYIRHGKNKDIVEEENSHEVLQVVKTNNNVTRDPNIENERVINVAFVLDNLDAVVAFDTFMKVHEKKYQSLDEKHKRFSIFMNNYLKVEEHNNKGFANFKQKMNRFSDMNYEEIRSKILTLKSDKMLSSNMNIFYNEESTDDLIKKYKEKRVASGEIDVYGNDDSMKNYDWRDYNVVTQIKDQGDCGSCWAFSVVAQIETQYSISKKILTVLSEQQLVDCSDANFGCNGGMLGLAYDYVFTSGGLCTEKDYPYIGERSPQCSISKCQKSYPISGIKKVEKNKFKEVIRYIGPISVSISASNDFVFYKEGIFDGACEEDGGNHAVVLVGYGMQKQYNAKKKMYEDVYYYIIRNSWGLEWGENGYMKIITNKNGTFRKCELGEEAYVSLVKLADSQQTEGIMKHENLSN